jgi:hypothetical protein
VKSVLTYAAVAENARFSRCMSRKSAAECELRRSSWLEVQIWTMRCGSANGSGRISTPLTTLKIAVLAPIPSARVMTATAVKPGFFVSARNA